MIALLRRTLILATLAASLFPLGALAKGMVVVNDEVTLIVFRHADRDAGKTVLNATGVARAAALPAALEGHHIDAIYRPDIARNLDTVTPLALARGIDTHIIENFHMPDVLAKQAAGSVVVWVGNKDNLKRLWERIGASGEAPLKYGDLFFVTFTAGASPEVVRKYFGQ